MCCSRLYDPMTPSPIFKVQDVNKFIDKIKGAFYYLGK